MVCRSGDTYSLWNTKLLIKSADPNFFQNSISHPQMTPNIHPLNTFENDLKIVSELPLSSLFLGSYLLCLSLSFRGSRLLPSKPMLSGSLSYDQGSRSREARREGLIRRKLSKGERKWVGAWENRRKRGIDLQVIFMYFFLFLEGSVFGVIFG